MKTLNIVALALVSTIATTTVGCADLQATDSEQFGEAAEDVAFRCWGGLGCMGGNTPYAAGFDISNVPTDFYGAASHGTLPLEIEVLDAWKWMGGTQFYMSDWRVTDENELQFDYYDEQELKVLKGKAVERVVIRLNVTDTSTSTTETVELLVVAADCSLSDATTCMYQVGTTTTPSNTDNFLLLEEETPELGDVYSICETDPEYQYGDMYDYKAITFNQGTELDVEQAPDGLIQANSDHIGLACAQGAIAHAVIDPNLSNIRYGSNVYRSTESDAFSNAIVAGIRAWWAGAPRTEPGNKILMKDCYSQTPLFDWPSTIPSGYELDSFSNEVGTTCSYPDWRGGSGPSVCGNPLNECPDSNNLVGFYTKVTP